MEAPTYQAAHDLYAEEARRVCAVLAGLIAESKQSRIAIERHLRLSPTSLGKVLSGSLRLSYGHVLAILDALEVDRGEFFTRLYPGKNEASDQRLDKVLAAREGEALAPREASKPDPLPVEVLPEAEPRPALGAPQLPPLAIQEWIENLIQQAVADYFRQTSGPDSTPTDE